MLVFTLVFLQVLATAAALRRADGSQEVLAAHNAARAKHGAAPLTWDPKLASYAAAHAKSCQFQHTNGPYGENLAAGTGLSYKGAVDMWMAEEPSYQPSAGFSSSSGHFTQVVWKGSKRLGCARITTCSGSQLGMGRRGWTGDDIQNHDGSSSDHSRSINDERRLAPAWRVAGHVGPGKPKKQGKLHHKQKSYKHKDHKHKNHHKDHKSKTHKHKGHHAREDVSGINTRDVVDNQDGKRYWQGFDGIYYLPDGTYPNIDIGGSADVGGGTSTGGAAPPAETGAPGGTGGNSDGSGYALIMCEYDPPGNVMGEFAQNVQ
ncbi:sterol-binding protein [Tilletia horrida]|uniref:Sterol-binding protein n=1 Tax=Tilletia horrida TaxID=155126 RepID=A0AAN6GM12_9BASI|nr:sterol-binding protein [Tilletia horrida]KAK0547515.1 sterol-binding protein [Tilletia horrida]